MDDELEELQSLFQLFDRDKDGVLSVKEFQSIIRCLGLHVNMEQAADLAASVSLDVTGFSVCFNEYLKFVSIERKKEPDHTTLLDMFQ